MYLHKVMKAPDCDQFLKAMDKELDNHISCKHWEVIPKENIPKGTKLLDMVWAMHRKRCIDTTEVYKWKARLDIQSLWSELLGNLCPVGIMANSQTFFFYPFYENGKPDRLILYWLILKHLLRSCCTL